MNTGNFSRLTFLTWLVLLTFSGTAADAQSISSSQTAPANVSEPAPTATPAPAPVSASAPDMVCEPACVEEAAAFAPKENGIDSPIQDEQAGARSSSLLIGSSTVNSTAPDDTSLNSCKVENLTIEILEQEIELLKLNTDFRVATTDKSRIKPWRTFLYNIAGAGVATGGIVTIMSERWRTLKDPSKVNQKTLKAGPIMLLTSHSIIASGIVLEATLDKIGDFRQRKKGLNSSATKKRAITLCHSIDEKMSRRDALCSSLSSLSERDRSILAKEGKVLRDLRNLALGEYSKFHVRSRKRLAARDTAYLNGFCAATTGGAGSLLGLLAVTEKKPRMAGPGGIGFTISGFNIVTGPLLGRAVANVAGSLRARKLKRDLGPIEPSKLTEAVGGLKTLSPGGNVKDRLQIYESVDALLTRQGEMDKAEKKKADREFLERCLFNGIVGGTKMGWGIQLMNAGFGFHPPPPATTAEKSDIQKAFDAALPKRKTGPQLFGQRVAEGATTYTVGTSTWILDTLQARTRGEMDVYTMGQQAALPHQKLADRTSKLNEMSAKLKEISQQPESSSR